MPSLQDKSALLDALHWFDQPGQSVLNLLRGNPGAAGRHALDFLAGPIDLLPGDLIPQFSRPEDTVRGGDLVGVDRDAHPFLASLADAGVGAVTNPLTYLGFGKGRGVTFAGQTIAGEGLTLDPLTLAGKAGRAGIDALPSGARATANRTLQGARETLGWLDPNEGVADLAARAEARAGGVGKAKSSLIEQSFAGTDLEDRQRAFRLIQGYDRVLDPATGSSKVVPLGQTSFGQMGTVDDQAALLDERLRHATWTPEEKGRARDLAMRQLLNERGNFAEAVQDFPAMHASFADGQSIQTHAPLDYAQRLFSAEDMPTSRGIGGGLESSLRSRALPQSDHLVDFLTNNPDMSIEEDLATSAANRATQQARMAKRATIGQELIDRGARGELGEPVQGAVLNALEKAKRSGNPLAGDQFSTLTDARSRSVVDDVIAELEHSSPDDARLLKTQWNGLEPRGPVMQGIANLNRLFKPAAVFGLGFPGKPAATMRNILAFPTQLAAEEDLGFSAALQQAKRTPATIGHAFGSGLDHAFGTDVTTGAVAGDRALIDEAFRVSGGRNSQALAELRSKGRDDLADMLQQGVLEHGFVNAESMMQPIRDSRLLAKGMDKLGVSPEWKDRVFNFLEGGQESFQGAEESARSRTFLDKRNELLQHDVPLEDANARAAAATRNALYDYSTWSEKQRGLADLVPFAKFTTNAIRQNAKWISRQPGVATTLAGLYGQDDNEPLYPYLQEQLHVKLGQDEKGNPEYLAGLGLPLEALNQVPNLPGDSTVRGLGRDVERIIGGSAQPLLKTAYSVVAGHDPYFATPVMSYDRLPGGAHGGEAGRVYNLLAGTGLFQPLETPINLAGKLVDDRHAPADKAIDMLTGANVVSVDPQAALQQQLSQALEANPEVQQYRELYVPRGVTPNGDTAALLDELQRMKAAARKKAAATVP